jgi:hypothetical protein
MNKSQITETLTGFNQRVGEMLPGISSLSNEQLAVTLHVYERLVGPYFIGMMAMVRAFCQSPEAHEACTENLNCEVGEDHQMMLRTFTAQIDCWVDYPMVKQRITEKTQHAAIHGHVAPLLDLVCFSNTSLPGLWIMGGLETSSQVFIPWMEQAAERLNMANTEYLVKHGIADIAHADEFARAIAAEETLLGTTMVTDRVEDHEALGPVYHYLRHIFLV